MKILVIAPHADDEIIGCGGMIAKRVQEGHSADIVVAAIGAVRKQGEGLKSTSETRHQELAEAARIIGAQKTRVLFDDVENKLDTLSQLELISKLDLVLNEGDYDQVFFPYASHHQDHRVLFDACFSALREGARKRSPSLVALYEYPYIGWQPAPPPGGRFYVDISAQIGRKMEALNAYRTQLYPPPHPTSLEAIETLAKMRGMECRRSFAEMFYLLKMID